MPDAQEFRDDYACLADFVEKALSEAFAVPGAHPAPLVAEAARYSLLAGGKRIRPVLALATARLLGCPPEAALPFACAIEMIHTYSLIHDDLPCMDDDDFRRGRPTCHKVYGEAVAVLAGDALLNLAYETMTRACLQTADGDRSVPGGIAGALRAQAEIAEAAGHLGMVGGQTVDVAGEGRALDAASLEAMHRMKTGALLRAPAAAAAHLAGASDAARDAVARFASALGLAFQIKDDLLDGTAEAAELGKTPGKDAAAGKTTFVSLFGAEGAAGRLAEESRHALEALDDLDGEGFDSEFLRGLVRYQLERRK
jgi:geranylgeranyl diphosphate synthase, type II